MKLTTLQYRIKDETTAKHLNKMAGAVNFTWNYCNEVNFDNWQKFHKTYSAFELNNKTAGCGEQLGLLAQTIQAVAEEYAKCCKASKTPKLAWRSRKRSLGWVPFKGEGLRLVKDSIFYKQHKFKFWMTREIEGKIRFGSFSQDSKGRWFMNLVIEDADRGRISTGKVVGIDLGLKTIATLSDGNNINRVNITQNHERKLGTAQRANKKKLVKTIHSKIRNQRKDWNHKQTTQLIHDYDMIAVGDVSSSKLKKTRMAKSVSDAGWFDFKRMLAYKAIALGSVYKEVNENFSTVTCSVCKELTGPKGQASLGVRLWKCSYCGASHNRDVNAATNILLSAQGIVRRRESTNGGCQ